jgi:hypothetical protein
MYDEIAAKKKRRQEDPEYRKREYESHKKYIDEHKDETNAYYKEYYEKNKEHMRELGRERTRKYRENNKEKVKASTDEYRSTPEYKAKASIIRKKRYEDNKEYEKEQSILVNRNRKLEILYWYSDGSLKCSVCGETHIEFLEIDHINNDGGIHRKEIGGSGYLYHWLINNNFPDGYQVLCRNCNIKKVKLNAVGLQSSATTIQKTNYIQHLNRRLKVIKKYSNDNCKCECCGNDDIDVLCLDHIDGGGNAHRRELEGQNLTDWIIQNDYPDGFRILCENCNKSLGHYGYCPHSPSPQQISPV